MRSLWEPQSILGLINNLLERSDDSHHRTDCFPHNINYLIVILDQSD